MPYYFQQKLKIERIGTQLKILPEGHGSFDIFPMNKETLYFPAFQAKFKFDKSSHGTYNKATVYNGKNKAGKLQRLKAEDLNQLNSDVYTGNYYSDEFDMYIKITESNNILSIKNAKFGTVGCVALDKSGNISAGTSTGGMTNKRWGRIGDSPVIGSGTYANNLTCGVSSTGWGEYFIRSQVAYDISAQMEYQNKTLKEATTDVIQNKLTKLGGTGGVVALDKKGNMSFEFNTAGMYRASMNDKGDLIVKIYKE